MASFSSRQFQLTSNQTALALVVPSHLQSEINSLRRIHDKAFRKWDPHINILYPFVHPAQLASAVSILRGCCQTKAKQIAVDVEEVGVFRHRKNATVFLKPSADSEINICQLRSTLVHALGCNERDGTHDGTFRPHMTIGQAALTGLSIEKLTEQVEKVAGVQWVGRSLAVLKREPSGEMRLVEEIKIGGDDTQEDDETTMDPGWGDCYHFNADCGWTQDPTIHTVTPKFESEIAVITYNLMAESFAPSFTSRLELILQALSIVARLPTSSVKVLSLQEVNHEMLPLLLSDHFIQKNFPFSTHTVSSILPSHRNLVTLASVPFTHFLLPFLERHKTSLIIATRGAHVANVHLTSALYEEAVEAKRNQMETLSRFLTHNETAGRNVFVAGDFNLTTSSSTLETAVSRNFITPETKEMVSHVIDSNIWEDSFSYRPATYSQVDQAGELFDGEEGATFDRLTNHLAALSQSPIDNRPQRYDRVLFKKGGNMTVRAFENFGFPTKEGLCGSDHYGTCVTFENTASIVPNDGGVDSTKVASFEVVEDSTDLGEIIEHFLPNATDREKRVEAIALLKQTLASEKIVSDIVFAPLGSYCMDTYFADSDVDLLAIGSIPPQAFFDLATAKLHALDNGFKGVHFVNSLVSVVEVCILGIKFDLQYCQAPELLARYHARGSSSDLAALMFDQQLLSTLSPSSLRPLNTYRDTIYILNSVPDLPSYRTIHRYLSLYLKRRGLYSAKFGYLGGIHLSLMLNHLLKVIGNNRVTSPASIVRAFFSYYAAFDWTHDNIIDPSLPSHRTVPRSPRDSIFIYSIHTPTARPNVASSCTSLTSQTLAQEFKEATEKLQVGDWEWGLRPGVFDFLNGFGAFVKVEVDMWDLSEMEGDKVREMLGALESKFPRLMVALGRVDGLRGQIWPARFRPSNAWGDEQLKGYYLIGVSVHEEGLATQEKRLFTSKVVTAVREFEGSVRESKELQGGNIWVSMEMVPKKKILDMDLVPDERDWGASQPEAEDVAQDEQTLTAKLPSHRRSTSSSLRPAQDIIARIHWDAALSVDDFVIGYEDRFVGVKELPLGKWKSEQTDEEFIPRHRIVWVRRKEEGGEKVWDRRSKLDLLFRSGVPRR